MQRHNNIDLSMIPAEMPISMAADQLLTAREQERRVLIFNIGTAVVEDMGYDAMATPQGMANKVNAYVDALMNVAYAGTVPAFAHPHNTLVRELAEEEEVKLDLQKSAMVLPFPGSMPGVFDGGPAAEAYTDEEAGPDVVPMEDYTDEEAVPEEVLEAAAGQVQDTLTTLDEEADEVDAALEVAEVSTPITLDPSSESGSICANTGECQDPGGCVMRAACPTPDGSVAGEEVPF